MPTKKLKNKLHKKYIIRVDTVQDMTLYFTIC